MFSQFVPLPAKPWDYYLCAHGHARAIGRFLGLRRTVRVRSILRNRRVALGSSMWSGAWLGISFKILAGVPICSSVLCALRTEVHSGKKGAIPRNSFGGIRGVSFGGFFPSAVGLALGTS
jgi:hypothetical protein